MNIDMIVVALAITVLGMLLVETLDNYFLDANPYWFTCLGYFTGAVTMYLLCS